MRFMKLKTLVLGTGTLVAASALACAGVAAQRQTGDPSGQLFTVLNPTGNPPPIDRKSMTPRPASLDGKTVYFVDITFANGDVLLQKMQKWFAANMPKVNTVFKVKQGGVGTDDPGLWKEIKAVDGLMIMAIGH